MTAEGLAELLDIRPGHTSPQMAAYPAHRGTHDGGADDRGREQDADHGTHRGSAPGPVPGGHLVLVDMYLARVVLGDHRGVVGTDRTSGVEVLDHLVVVSCRRLARI